MNNSIIADKNKLIIAIGMLKQIATLTDELDVKFIVNRVISLIERSIKEETNE